MDVTSVTLSQTRRQSKELHEVLVGRIRGTSSVTHHLTQLVPGNLTYPGILWGGKEVEQGRDGEKVKTILKMG